MIERTLKPGWSWVKFGDVVKLNMDRCADPASEGIERYVGLEHIEPEDLRIRRWGQVAEGTTFTNLFRPGQVLFGKRRAYQRKVAVADFEGVCSGDIYVFEPKNDRLLPELLPFICQTESFFEYAVGTSAGSLSPRTNWTQLANYEFALPPLEEQCRIAKILNAHEKVIWKLSELVITNSNLLKALIFNLLSGVDCLHEWNENLLIDIPAGWSVVALDSILKRVIDYRGRTPNKSSTGIPLITARNVREGYLAMEPEEFIPSGDYDSWMTRGIPQPGDVFFTMEAPLGYVAPVPDFKFALAQRIVVLQPDQTVVSQRFLYWLMQSPLTQHEVQKRATGTTAKGIKQSTLLTIPVLVPPFRQQELITERLDATLASQKAVAERLEKACFNKKQVLKLYLQEK